MVHRCPINGRVLGANRVEGAVLIVSCLFGYARVVFYYCVGLYGRMVSHDSFSESCARRVEAEVGCSPNDVMFVKLSF